MIPCSNNGSFSISCEPRTKLLFLFFGKDNKKKVVNEKRSKWTKKTGWKVIQTARGITDFAGMSSRKRSRGGARATASEGSSGSRSLRQKVSKSMYAEHGLDSDSDEEGRQAFSLEDKLASTKFPKYCRYFVKEMQGHDVNLTHFQRTGFQTPIWIKSKTGLEMTVPEPDFSVTGEHASK